MVKKAVYKPLVRFVIILLLCPVVLYGCDNNDDDYSVPFYDIQCDCGDEMAYFRGTYGEPEEIHRYNDGDYHRRVWWYWSLGFKVVFEWFGHWYIDDGECCEVTVYKLEPSYDERGRLIIDLFKEEQERKTEKPNNP